MKRKRVTDRGLVSLHDDLPLLPPPGTVARRLIEDTVAMCRASSVMTCYTGRRINAKECK